MFFLLLVDMDSLVFGLSFDFFLYVESTLMLLMNKVYLSARPYGIVHSSNGQKHICCYKTLNIYF